MFGVLALTFWLPCVPDWAEELKPQAQMRVRYQERWEDPDLSGLELAARIGIFPKIDELVELGIELSTAGAGLQGRPEAVSFSQGSASKSIALSQAYIALQQPLNSHSRATLSLGKFANPFKSSPYLWDQDRRPEGAYQALAWRGRNFHFRFQAGQYSADRVEASLTQGRPLRRSWLFVQGAEFVYRLSQSTQLRFNTEAYAFYDISERLQEASGELGNSTQAVTPPLRLQEKFLPLHLAVEMQSEPIGIPSSIFVSAAINPRSTDNDRGLYVLGSLGQHWEENGSVLALSYYYSEPDLSLAFFTDNEYAQSNRQAGRARLYFYPRAYLGVSVSYLYASVLKQNPRQEDRQEILGQIEMRY